MFLTYLNAEKAYFFSNKEVLSFAEKRSETRILTLFQPGLQMQLFGST